MKLNLEKYILLLFLYIILFKKIIYTYILFNDTNYL